MPQLPPEYAHQRGIYNSRAPAKLGLAAPVAMLIRANAAAADG